MSFVKVNVHENAYVLSHLFSWDVGYSAIGLRLDLEEALRMEKDKALVERIYQLKWDLSDLEEDQRTLERIGRHAPTDGAREILRQEYRNNRKRIKQLRQQLDEINGQA